MEKEIKEILKDYMTERQIELALPRLVNFISSNLLVSGSVCGHPIEAIVMNGKKHYCMACNTTIL